MAIQQIMTTENGRLREKVTDKQKAMGYQQCWYSEIKDDAAIYNSDIDEATNMKNCEWKRILKRKLRERIEKQSIEKEAKNTKLRRQSDKKYERQKYLGEVGIKATKEIIRLSWKCGTYVVILARKGNAGDSEESREHAPECKKVNGILERNGEKEWVASTRS